MFSANSFQLCNKVGIRLIIKFKSITQVLNQLEFLVIGPEKYMLQAILCEGSLLWLMIDHLLD
jgi:hypothetical protein